MHTDSILSSILRVSSYFKRLGAEFDQIKVILTCKTAGILLSRSKHPERQVGEIWNTIQLVLVEDVYMIKII